MKFSAFVCYEESKLSTGIPDFRNYVNYCKHYIYSDLILTHLTNNLFLFSFAFSVC
jgi:hypothetical protein